MFFHFILFSHNICILIQFILLIHFRNVKIFVLLMLTKLAIVESDVCHNTKHERHKTVMEQFRYSNNWNKILTLRMLLDNKIDSSIDLSRQGFKALDFENDDNSNDLHLLFKLDLSYNNLEEIRNEHFNYMINLHALNLAFNKITELKNDTFFPLIGVIELDLSYNLISSIGERTFSKSFSLETLNLQGNCLLKVHNYQFFYNDLLTSVILSDNELYEIPMDILDSHAMVDEMFEVDFSGNKFEHFPYVRLKTIDTYRVNGNKMTNIQLNESLFVKNLFAQDNMIRDVDLFRFSSTEYINLANNDIRNIGGLYEKNELQYLDLSSNDIRHFIYSIKHSLASLSSLEMLILRNVSLNDDNISDLFSSNTLINLVLSQNDFKTLDLMKFAKLTSLEYLNLNLNYLERLINYEKIKEILPLLKGIELSYNKWGCPYFEQVYEHFEKEMIVMPTNKNDCFVNGTRVYNSTIPDIFQNQYTLQNVKRDLNLVKNLARTINWMSMHLFLGMIRTDNRTSNGLRSNQVKLTQLEEDYQKIFGMIVFITITLVFSLVGIVCFLAYKLYLKDKLKRAPKVVSYNSRTNEIANGGA